MAQRGITERQIMIILNGGHRTDEPAPPGAPARWKYSGFADGRQIRVIAAEGSTGMS